MAYPYDDPEEALIAEAIKNNRNLRNASVFGAGFAPGSGLLDAFGGMPAMDQGMSPSMLQNMQQGNYLDTFFQGLGAGGDLAMMTGALAPAGVAMKAAAAAGKAGKAAAKIAKPPMEDALQLAQKRAALPVSEGGLGLPTGNTAMDRAKAMGADIDTDYIHVGNEPITEIKNTGRFPGIFSLKNDSAAGYGRISSPFYVMGDTAKNSDLLNYTNKDLKYAVGSTGKKAEEKLNYAIRDEIPSDSEDIAEAVGSMQNIRMRLAKSMGYPSVKMSDEFSNTVALLPGDNIRSRFAAFDPFRRNAAIAAAMGVAAPNLMAQDRDEEEKNLMRMIGR